MRTIILVGSLALALAGCASYRPPPAASLATEVLATTPADEGQVKLFGHGIWWPDTIGFSKPAQSRNASDVLVFTDKSILLSQWDKRSGTLKITKKIRLADIRSLALASSGPDRLIVIQGKDYHYDSLGFSEDRDKPVDPGKTVAGYQALVALLLKK